MLMRSRPRIESLLCVCGIWAFLLFAHFHGATTIVAATDSEFKIRNEAMEVVLDRHFPRVFEYHVGSQKVLGAQVKRPGVELNSELYSPADYTVLVDVKGSRAVYTMVFPQLKLSLKFEFTLEHQDLILRLLEVKEQGDFRLNTLYFPDHHLVRVSEREPGATYFRIGIRRSPRNKRNPEQLGYVYGRLFDMATVKNRQIGLLSDEVAEPYPETVNWTAAYTEKICASVRNNIGFRKVCTQRLGYPSLAKSYALWNNVYHYRVRGKVRPLLESHVGIITEDRNWDGKVDWMEAALWHRKFLPPMNPVYKDAIVTKILCAWSPFNKDNPYDPQREYSLEEKRRLWPPPLTTFDQCLDFIRTVYNITGGAPLVTYLVGWQYDGHDTGYPAMDKVNERLGGREKLIELVEEAKKYNCTVSYHCNIDDSHEGVPGFADSYSSLCLDRDGKPYLWGYHNPDAGSRGVPAIYHINHTKELETGYFYRRMQAFLDAVPVHKTVHLDTFRYSNESLAPGDEINLVEEMVACETIMDWFNARGIDVTSEAAYDGFFGRQSHVGHLLSGIQDPFTLIMIHGKIWGDMKGGDTPAPEVLGWNDLTGQPGFDAPDSPGTAPIYDSYYLGTLFYHYLAEKELVSLGHEGEDYVARFDDGCVSRLSKEKTLLTQVGDLVVARGQDRFIPISDSEIRLYSLPGGERAWTLPEPWRGRKLELITLGETGRSPGPAFEIVDDQIKLTMEPRHAYALHRKE